MFRAEREQLILLLKKEKERHLDIAGKYMRCINNPIFDEDARVTIAKLIKDLTLILF